MNPAIRTIIKVGYGLALAVLVANAVLAYLDIRAIVRGNWWVEHTGEVVAQLERVASALKDAETGQRGYLLTGKDEYLKPYVDASNGLDKELDRLVTLTADNPLQQARLAELRRIAGEKIAELGRTVALMREGDRDAALAVVQTGRGRALMDRARALVAEMRAEEDRLLSIRSAASHNAAWRAVASVLIASVIVASSLMLVSHLKRREDAEKGRAAEALRESEEWLVRMMESIGDGVIATDGRGRVRLINPVAQGLTGWTQDEAVGRSIEEVFVIVNEGTRQPAENPAFRAIREGVVMGLANHTLLISRGGAETSIDDSAAPIKDRSGKVVGVVMVFQNATERRRHEAALRTSEARHRTILESITDAFFALDRSWRFTYLNRHAEALLSRTRDELLGKHLWEEYAPAVGTEFERSYNRAMGEGVTVTFEAFYPPHERWYEVHAYPSPEGLSVYFRDVNERKRAEAELRATEERRRLALDSAELGAWHVDSATNSLTTDERFRRIFHGSDAPITFEQAFVAIHPDDRERVRERVEAAMRPDDPVPYAEEYRVVQPDGSIRWVFGKGRANFGTGDAGRRLVSLDGTLADITERKRADDLLRAAKEEAEDANRAKDDFLAVLSHELRTPLNPILLATTAMIDRPTPPEEFHPTLEMIRQNVNLQARLIDDLLDVMRIVRGKMPLHWGVSDCHDLIARAVEITRSDALGKRHQLVLDLIAEDRCVNADAARIQQVFWNLLKNAIKFTPEGGTITVRTRNEGEAILIEVADTGIGIEAEILPQVFDAFHQGDARITRKFGGLGLGLAICRGVVEAHGGTIAAESDGKGCGTTFRIALKTMPVPEDMPSCDEGDGTNRAAQATSLNRLSILAVDDEPTTLHLMARLLGSLGHRVETAGSVADAWEKFQGADGFDLIISDIGLPDGSGLDLMRKVKAVRFVPAIALTGYGMDEDIRRSREAGFTTHMTKPIDFTKLEAMIRQVAN